MRNLELPPGASFRQWCQIHGESFKKEIAEISQIRLGLTTRVGEFDSEATVLDLARQHMPVLERFDRDLYEEVVGIAEGAGIDEARDAFASIPGVTSAAAIAHANSGATLTGNAYET